MYFRPQVIISVVPLLLLSLALFLWSHEIWTYVPSHGSSATEASCTQSLDWIQDLGLTYPIAFARRDIIVQIASKGRKSESITNVKKDLFAKSRILDFTESSSSDVELCNEPLRLEAPGGAQSTTDAATLLFGLSTNATQLAASIPRLERWLSWSRSKLVVMLSADGNTKVNPLKTVHGPKDDLERRFREKNMEVEIIQSHIGEGGTSDNALSLLKHMYDTRDEQVRWLSIIDSQTFFPSLNALTAMLSRYDPLEQHYIGGLPEKWWTVIHHGLMGSISSGIFISLVLADTIIAEYEFCAKRMQSKVDLEDYRIMRCINELSETRLTIERELRPMHLEGDLSGVLESGRPPLSMYEKWSDGSGSGANFTMMHSIADLCPTCFLRRWRFKNDLILTGGYSIAKYHDSSLEDANLEHLEATWDEPESDSVWPMHGAEHVVGPIRPALQLDQQKLQHRLIHSRRLEDGSVRQVYHRKATRDGPDDVLELLWQNA